jgi:hypothetical protein
MIHCRSLPFSIPNHEVFDKFRSHKAFYKRIIVRYQLLALALSVTVGIKQTCTDIDRIKLRLRFEGDERMPGSLKLVHRYLDSTCGRGVCRHATALFQDITDS